MRHGVSPWLTSSYFCLGPCGEQIGNAQASAEHNPCCGKQIGNAQRSKHNPGETGSAFPQLPKSTSNVPFSHIIITGKHPDNQIVI